MFQRTRRYDTNSPTHTHTHAQTYKHIQTYSPHTQIHIISDSGPRTHASIYIYLTGVAILGDIILAFAIGGVAKIAQIISAGLIARYITRRGQRVTLHAQVGLT